MSAPADDIARGVDISMSIVRAYLTDDQLCGAINDAVRLALVFAIGYGAGCADRWREET